MPKCKATVGKLNIEENRLIFNESYFPLIRLYTDSFMASVEAFVKEDNAGFEIHKRTVRTSINEIISIFNIEIEEISRFAFSYVDKTHLLNGVFSRGEDDHLYFIKGGNFIKIGRTNNPDIRLSALQTSSTEELSYLRIFNLRGCYEFQVHAIFDYLRVRGEWFEDHEDIRDFIKILSERNSELSVICSLHAL